MFSLRLALRSLAKAPGFALVAILTVALGLASVTAIYSVADAVVFRPLPFKDESSLVWVWSTRPDRDRAFFSIPNFLDLQRDNRTTVGFAPVTPLGVTLSGLGEPERVAAWRTTADLYSVLGTPPHVGRFPSAADGGPGAPLAVVLGYGYWQRRFGADPAVVGRTLALNGVNHLVTGVAPPGFAIPHWDTDLLITQPLETDVRRADRGTSFLRGIARLKPGVTPAQAQAEFAAINARLVREFPDANSTVTAPRFVPLREEVAGGYRASLLLLLGAAAVLLLIMCTNLAGLLAARALTRRRDAALCSALGASPARLLRTYLAEGFAIALAGGALGVLACWWSLDALLALAPADLPRASQVALDLRVLGVALGCTLVTAVGVGLAPAWRLARTAPQDVLRSGSAGATSRTRAHGVLVATQFALCTALLVGTGLLVRSLRELLATHPGFEPASVLTAQVAPAPAHTRTVATLTTFVEGYAARLAALPGVASVSVTSVLPLTGLNTRSEFVRVDRPPANPADTASAANRYIVENYFATVGIPLLAGRDFTPHDTAATRGVVIIDRALAARDWPGEDPVGRLIRVKDGPVARELEIVGVVGATKHFRLEETATPALYLAFRQMPPTQLPFLAGRMTFVTKTTTDLRTPVETARRELRALDASATATIRSLDEVTAWARAPRIFNLRLFGFFSGAAVLLAALGLYAATAQVVAASTREIGIRMALGADRARIVCHLLGGNARLALAGIGGGLVLAALFTPLLARMLYDVDAFDPLTYSAVAGSLAIIALLATWLPARRATKVDPLVALRTE